MRVTETHTEAGPMKTSAGIRVMHLEAKESRGERHATILPQAFRTNPAEPSVLRFCSQKQ